MTTTALPESEASRILRVDPAGLAQLVRAGHLTATLAPDGYRFTPEQVHALQPRAAGLVASLQSEVEQARRARAKAQLEQAKGLALQGTILGGAAVAVVACAAAPGLALPLLVIAGGVFALGMPRA